MTEKEDIIKKVYYDKSGFNSKKITLEDSKKRDKTITKKDIDDFFDKYVERKKNLKGYNSFVAPEANYEYQIDLMFFSDLENQKFKVGMVCIDIFSKYAVVVAIKSKKEGDVASGMLECLNKMKGLPKIIYTDDEGALKTEAMKDFFKEKDIKHIITRSHAHFSEIFIRYFKSALYKRIDNSEDENIQWDSLIFEIMLTYNNKLKHSAHGFIPADAAKKENSLDVKLNLEAKAKNTRRYPNISVGDNVKILRKKKVGEKERTSTWQEEKHEVVAIGTSLGQTFYKLSNLPKQYLRNEILKL